MASVAMSASDQPVAFDRNGTVRDERGLTSMMYTFSSLSTMNWMLYRPTMPMPRPSFFAYCRMIPLTLLEMENAG